MPCFVAIGYILGNYIIFHVGQHFNGLWNTSIYTGQSPTSMGFNGSVIFNNWSGILQDGGINMQIPCTLMRKSQQRSQFQDKIHIFYCMSKIAIRNNKKYRCRMYTFLHVFLSVHTIKTTANIFLIVATLHILAEIPRAILGAEAIYLDTISPISHI